MEKQFFQKYSKYSLSLLFIIGLLLALYLFLPFLTSMIASAIVVYIFYPLFKKINAKINNRSITSFIMIFLVFLIIIIPLFLIINALVIEAATFYQGIKNIDLGPLTNLVSQFIGENVDVTSYFQEIIRNAVSFIVKTASDFIFSLPQKFIIFFVTLFSLYYFFKDGNKIILFFKKLFPMKDSHKDELLSGFKKLIYATIYGVVITAVIQGVIGTIGLFLFDVNSPLLWGSIMVITAMIPFIGAYIIWFPAAVFKIANGELFNGFGLLIYGVLIVSTIDNLIKPKLISEKAQIHPLLIVLGVFGGLKAFGIIGLIIGPLLLGILSVLSTFYIKRLK